jgi:general L-amino acid transport system permease protein
MEESHPLRLPKHTPFWRDERVLRLVGQAVFLILIGLLLTYLAGNMLSNMRRAGLQINFGFLRLTSGFDIGEHLIPYARTDTFARAFLVGVLNTALVSVLGIVFSTLIGVVVGVARLSSNFLIQRLARAYIELLRNIPLLVLLIFFYLGIFIQLPRVRQAVILPGPTLLTNRGVAIPWGIPTAAFPTYLWVLGCGLLLAVLVGVFLSWRGRRTGRPPLVALWGLLTFISVAVTGWILLPQPPLAISTPAVEGLRMAGGLQLTPELMALLSGLTVYTSAFIADVVRVGIQSVSRGQVDAAKSLGLTGFLTLRLVVFPQALRVIIPPLTSQYLNLTKNSSLAVIIGYPELFHVSGTILNQSGRTVEMIAIVMTTYLAISLSISAFLNWYNRRVRLVER